MDGLGDFNKLPDDELRLVLDYLSFQDIANFRCTSKEIERRVTELVKSIFNKFHMKGINRAFCNFFFRGIDRHNCEERSRILSVAMSKLNAPENLELQFFGKFNFTMRKIYLDYKEYITYLGIDVCGNEGLLLQPDFQFPCLESLFLNIDSCYDDIMVDNIVKDMLEKHANNLKSLSFYGLRSHLTVSDSDLPILDSLSLMESGDKASRIILEKSKPTITSLVLDCSDMESLSFDLGESNNPTFYQISNLNHLKINYSDGLQFVIFNAEHLVSLDLKTIKDCIECPESVVWPKFPSLRELSIYGSDYLPILMNCRETLERLFMDHNYSDDDELANVKMPRLTDLNIIGGSVTQVFTNKIIITNHRSLEFLFLGKIDVSKLNDGGRKMEMIKNVVLGYWLGFNLPWRRNSTAEDRERMAVMFPNAEVVIWNKENNNEIRNLVKSRFKRKKFTADLTRFCL